MKRSLAQVLYFGDERFQTRRLHWAGFVSFAVGAVGKKVEKVTIVGWSKDKPSQDGATFELAWRD